MSLGVLPISLIVPPLNLLPIGVGGLALALRWRSIGIRIATFAICGLFLFSLPLVGDSLLVSLEYGLPLTPAATDPPAAIVILGGDSVRVAGGGHAVGPLTLERLRAGAELERRTGLPVLVSGGVVSKTGPALAVLMRRSLRSDFDVPVRWTEVASRDTWENAQDSAAILKANGISSIYVVTHAWHMRRALLAFAPLHLHVTAAPVRLDSMPEGDFDDFVPRVSAWRDSFFALHEWIGCIYYALRQ